MTDDISHRIIYDTEVPDEPSLADRVANLDAEQSWEPEYVPANGWQPEDFPQITIDSIPYTTNAESHAEPYMTIIATGWFFLEIGNVRIAIPDREEWDKLVNMGERMWNSHEAERRRLINCVCGAPETPGVVHRTDGPCYRQPEPGEQLPPSADRSGAACPRCGHPFGNLAEHECLPTPTVVEEKPPPPPSGVAQEGETHDQPGPAH